MKITVDKEVLEQALEFIDANSDSADERGIAAAIREVLAQPEQQWQSTADKVQIEKVPANGGLLPAQPERPAVHGEPFGHVTVRRLSQRFENHHDQYRFFPAGQSPYTDNIDECHAVYTTPQPAVPERKPLTDEEWQVIADTLHCCITRSQKDTIEAALGITGEQHG